MSHYQFVSAVAREDLLRLSIQSACDSIQQQLDGDSPRIDFAIFFSSGYATAACDQFYDHVARRLKCHHVIGCNAESVVRDGEEIEGEKCVSILVAARDGSSDETSDVSAFHVSYIRGDSDTAILGWPSVDEIDGATVVVLADPVSFPTDVLLEQIGSAPRTTDGNAAPKPPTVVVGGMCSAVFGNESFIGNPNEASSTVLACGANVLRSGAVALRLPSDIQVDTLVSQGCRGVGEPMIVTDCQRNEIKSLGGQTPIDKLREIFASLPQRDQQLFQSGLQLGIAMTEYVDEFQFGDFLIRGLTHIDEQTGFITVGDFLRKGQTVQFHLRDEHSAEVDLGQHLSRLSQNAPHPEAALLFLCNGRGMNLFSDPNHDAAMVQDRLGPIPVSGFLAAGEIGPVGGKNHVHGFTCVAAVFSNR